jgi:hypothetical protein
MQKPIVKSAQAKKATNNTFTSTSNKNSDDYDSTTPHTNTVFLQDISISERR